MPASRTTATVSRRTTLAGLGAGGLALALAASARPASGQDAATDLSTHPLTGTWLVIGNQSTPTAQLALPSHFLADGTVLLVTPPSQVGAQGVVFRGSRSYSLANTVACTVRGVNSITLLAALDLEGICASSGSACSAGSLEPSHVMLALGVEKDAANALVRFSLGRESTLEEIQIVEKTLPGIIDRAQRSE